MIFDQYSRYKACSDLIRLTGFVEGDSVLDVGSGPECLFGQFMPDTAMTYVDPLIESGSGRDRIKGTIFNNELDGQSFDCVSAVDVLEHVPNEKRKEFLGRISSLCRNTIILGFPNSDSSDAIETDKAICDQYYGIYGFDYSWLEEHRRFGLPSLTETNEQLNLFGWHCQSIGHGHAPWLRTFLGFVVCLWDIPSMKNLVLEISEKFNNELYSYDFNGPFYRHFVIATKNELAPINLDYRKNINSETEKLFRNLMDELQRKYFSESIRQFVAIKDSFAEREAEIQQLKIRIQEMSACFEGLQEQMPLNVATIAELKRNNLDTADSHNQALTLKDATITKLRQKLEEQERVVADKHEELIEMSNWAYGMMQELKNRNNALHVKLIKSVSNANSLLLTRIANSFIGDIIRYIRRIRRCSSNTFSLDLVRDALKICDGNLIIAFPIINWDFRWQRPQQIVTRLRDRGYCVIYIAMSLTPLAKKFGNIIEARSLLGFKELSNHILQIMLHSARQINIYTDPLEGDDLFNISVGLESLIQELKPSSINYLIQFPGWWPVVKILKERFGGRVVFDCMDDHRGFSTNNVKALETEQDLIKRADLVIASSAVLEDRCRILNCNTICAKNGTEFEHFSDPKKNGMLDHLADRPIIGYYGAISDWFDMEIVAYCAWQRPQWHFVLVGATTGADLGPVLGMANVHFLGEKPYQELPGYLAYFDVCTIPFKIIPLTMATNPVKFYEYLSAGKPVVSVPLPELSPYADNCYIASDKHDFLGQLEKALAERNDWDKVKRRLKLARENSWDARVEKILTSFTRSEPIAY